MCGRPVTPVSLWSLEAEPDGGTVSDTTAFVVIAIGALLVLALLAVAVWRRDGAAPNTAVRRGGGVCGLWDRVR